MLALQALLCDTRGEGPAAIESLAKALDLAEPGGFIRIFVDLGPQMADLLKQLIKQNLAVSYAGQILAAFKDDDHRAVPDPNSLLIPPSDSPHHPLTESPRRLPVSQFPAPG